MLIDDYVFAEANESKGTEGSRFKPRTNAERKAARKKGLGEGASSAVGLMAGIFSLVATALAVVPKRAEVIEPDKTIKGRGSLYSELTLLEKLLKGGS